jgi:hypothetical protein
MWRRMRRKRKEEKQRLDEQDISTKIRTHEQALHQ